MKQKEIMSHLSNDVLSFWNSLFTWVAIAGALAALVSGFGLKFVRDEIGSRKDAELENVKKRQLPRSLSADAKIKIKNLLSNSTKGDIIIQSDWTDTEGKEFAAQIKAILRDSGFNVLPFPTYELSVPKQGAFLFVKDDLHLPPDTLPIQQAFKAAGFLMPINKATEPMGRLFGPPESSHVLTADMVIIWVGQKP